MRALHFLHIEQSINALNAFIDGGCNMFGEAWVEAVVYRAMLKRSKY